MARTLVNAKQLELMSGSTATLAKFAQGVYTDGMSMESGSIHSAGTLTFYDGGSLAYANSKINLYSNTNVEGTLTANTSLTLDSTTITTAEIGVLDSVTAGTAAASKAVVLDASKNIATIGTVGCGAITSTGASTFGSINVGGTITGDTSLTLDAVTISTAELGVLDSVTAGTAAASKAVVLDGSKNIATIGTVGCGAITSTGNSAMAQLTTSGRVIVDDATDATSTTDGSLQTDGGLSVAKDGIFGNDVKLKSDAAVLAFGDGSDVTLTHVADTALLLNSSRQLQFGDSATYIHQASDGNLKLAADGALLLSSDTVQVESANSLDPMLELKNTTNDGLGARLHFLKDKGAAAADDDIVGIIAWSGDNDAQEQTTYAEMMCQIADASNGTEGGKLVLRVASHDGEMNNGIIISDGDVEDEIDVILGNGAASTVTIPGNLIVTGTTTTVDVEVVNTANGVIFEGATDDAYETTLKAVDPTGADKTIQLANVSGFLQPFAAASTVAITSIPAELNLLDGSTAVGSSITIADADGLVVHDDGVMKTIPFSDVKTYAGGVDIDTYAALGSAGVHQTQDHFIFSDNGTEKKITFSNLQDAVFADVSGDATIAAGGAVTIAADAITGAKIALFDDSLAATTTHFLIADGTDYSSFALSGDVTCTNAGVVTIAAASVEHGMLAEDIISGQAELAHADIADADEMMISDNGTIKRVGVDSLRDHFFGVVSGDATVADGGALTIAAGAVENSMLADDAVGADELAANAVVNASVVDGSLNADKLDIDGSTDIGADLVDADLFIVDDGAGGTNRKSTLTRMKKYVYSAMSGDATASDAGALTIAANAVEGTMLNSNCGGNGIAVVSNALTVDFAMERCIGSSGHSYTTASGVYTLPATPVSGSEMVFLNGQMLYRGDSTDSAAGSGDYTTATGSVELHADLKLDADDVLQVYFLL
jgi:hypothetical protein